MIITQINLINTNIKKNPFNKQITVPFLKEGFDLQNKDIVSFGRKKTKEKVDKNQKELFNCSNNLIVNV